MPDAWTCSLHAERVSFPCACAPSAAQLLGNGIPWRFFLILLKSPDSISEGLCLAFPRDICSKDCFSPDWNLNGRS